MKTINEIIPVKLEQSFDYF